MRYAAIIPMPTAQVLINALIVQVKSPQNHMSDYPTIRPLTGFSRDSHCLSEIALSQRDWSFEKLQARLS